MLAVLLALAVVLEVIMTMAMAVPIVPLLLLLLFLLLSSSPLLITEAVEVVIDVFVLLLALEANFHRTGLKLAWTGLSLKL